MLTFIKKALLVCLCFIFISLLSCLHHNLHQNDVAQERDQKLRKIDKPNSMLHYSSVLYF